MSEIQNLVRLYYKFYQRLDISTNIVELLYKNKDFYDDIENMGN